MNLASPIKNMDDSLNMFAQNTTRTRTEVDTTLQIISYFIIGVLALPGNVILVYLTFVSKKISMEGLGLLQNLAVSDILIIFTGVPLTIANLASNNGIVTDGKLCQAQGFVLLALFLNSNFNITLVAAHRYLFIVKNSFYKKMNKQRRIHLVISSTWMTALLVSIPSVGGWGKQDYNFNRAHCMVVWRHSVSYLAFVQALAFFLPLLVIGFCYWNILKHVRASRNRNNTTKWGERRTPFKISVMISASFFVSFMPYALLIIHEGFLGKPAGEVFSFVAMASAYSNGICDFFIYSYNNRNFRKAVKTLFCWTSSRVRPAVAAVRNEGFETELRTRSVFSIEV